MRKVSSLQTLAGVSIVAVLAFPAAAADGNPFQSTPIAGYQLADAGKAEGKCGGSKPAEGKCGGQKTEEGKCGSSKTEEGKCGAKKTEEGKCGAATGATTDAKSAEGKCGGKK